MQREAVRIVVFRCVTVSPTRSFDPRRCICRVNFNSSEEQTQEARHLWFPAFIISPQLGGIFWTMFYFADKLDSVTVPSHRARVVRGSIYLYDSILFFFFSCSLIINRRDVLQEPRVSRIKVRS
jgi:hypothetical protein